MKQKIITMMVVVSMIVGLIATGAAAAYSPRSSFDAPKDFTVQPIANESAWDGFEATVSAPQNLRDFMEEVWDENSSFTKEGFNAFTMYLQMDYKTDAGTWHYTKDWDSDFTYSASKVLCNMSKGVYSATSTFGKQEFENISQGETLPQNKSYYDSHTTDLRVRFLVHYQDADGASFDYFSPWSAAVSYSNNQKVLDYDAMINHTPVLKAVDLKKNWKGAPYLQVTADEPHEDLRRLNSITGGEVGTEVWLKVGNGDWVMCHTNNFVEEFNIGVEAYFGLKESYDAAVYQVKFLYTITAVDSKGAMVRRTSPFSNVISKGMSAYSEASQWAKTELDKADSYGLIPDSLKGADMTKPITREEFAEASVLLYEKTTGKTSEPVSLNPFKDTTNNQVLKAFKLGIVKGISDTTFAPRELTNREQVATMLSRAIRVMVPGGDFSTAGAPSFTDKKNISAWALEHALFMAKMGIINGADGKFMPKAVTTTEKASGYATTTREQALAMSTRIYEKYK